ncbi:MAG: glycosyltransferase family 4 protein [Hyphomicrobiaceae bacterium]|nr:glycosyltransferase family 4 protein [Hyphomicrobiaceae bacterium]
MSRVFRILHVLRAPVGGLFRHVRDLAVAQAARGHLVGVMVDSSSRDTLTRERLAALAPHLPLGLSAIPMSRTPGLSDTGPILAARRLARLLAVDVLHGHGAKGGLYARLAGTWLARPGDAAPARLYTPHGGSLHQFAARLSGPVYLAAERALAAATDGIIFESRFASEAYERAVSGHGAKTRIIHNGLSDEDFAVRPAPGEAAADVLFIGELRHLKGVDVLIDALARLPETTTAVIVGDGPDAAQFKEQTHRLGLGARIRFTGAMPARQAFGLGRILVMPSRAESLPYIALEAAAAAIPMIATSVGGVPEIVAGSRTRLVPPGDVEALACALAASLDQPAIAEADAADLREVVAGRFSLASMADEVLDFYAEALAARRSRPGHSVVGNEPVRTAAKRSSTLG